MNIYSRLLALVLIICSHAGLTQEIDIFDSYDLSSGNAIELTSRILDQNRDIYISVPADYDYSGHSYPVAYVLDSPGHFLMSSSIIRELSRYEKMPQMIVVGIGNGIDKPDRQWDLTPSTNVRGIGGGAGKFTEFLQDEVIPYINDNYRTNGYEMLHGHSLGGLFAINTLLNEPEMFDAYIAFSPWMQWNEGEPVADFREFLEGGGRFDNERLILTIASGDSAESREHFQQFVDVLDQHKPEGLFFDHRLLENENHNSLGFRSVYEGNLTLFDGFVPNEAIEDLEAFKLYYKNLSDKLGFQVLAPQRVLYRFAGSFARSDPEMAIAISDYSLEVHPNGLWSKMNIALSLQLQNRLDEAIEVLDEAILVANTHYRYPTVVKSNLNSLREGMLAQISTQEEQ